MGAEAVQKLLARSTWIKLSKELPLRSSSRPTARSASACEAPGGR